MQAAQREGVEEAMQRDPEEWRKMIEVAKYLADYKDAFLKLGKEQASFYPKMTEFLSKQANMSDNAHKLQSGNRLLS